MVSVSSTGCALDTLDLLITYESHPDFYFVILSEAKDLACLAEMIRFTQHRKIADQQTHPTMQTR
jgi:hypothetical protein